MQLKDTPTQDAARQIAASAGVQVDFVGGIITFSDTAADDLRNFYLLPSGYQKAEDLKEAIALGGGKSVEAKAMGDRVSVSVPNSKVDHVAAVMREWERGPDGWALTCQVVQVSDDLRSSIGIGLSAAASGTFGATAKSAKVVFGADAAAAVQVIAKAIEEGSSAKLVTTATLYLLEGTKARVVNGDRVPIAQRTVSPQGTVTVTGFAYVDTGFSLDAESRRVPDGLLVDLTPKLSNITGYVEGNPIVAERTVTGTVVLSSGGWCVLSGLDAASWSEGSKGLPGALRVLGGASDEAVGRSSVLVLVRAERVYRSGS